MISKKVSRVSVLTKSCALAFIAYVLLFFAYSYVQVSTKKNDFKLLTESIDTQKQRLIYTSLFVNTVFHIDEAVLEETYNNIGQYGIKTYVYPLTGESHQLNRDEKVVLSSLIYAFGNMHAFLLDDRSATYYQSFQGQGKFIFFSDMGQIDLGTRAIHDQRCERFRTCSRFSTAEALSDRLVVSKIYKDMISGEPTITLSSPVLHRGEVIGDVSVDMYAFGSKFGEEATYSSGSVGELNYVQISYPDYPLAELGFRSHYVIDNKSVLSFNYPVSKLLLDTLPAFFLLWCVSLLGVNHYAKLREAKANIAKVYEESHRDEMTGLYNRKVFNTRKFIEKTHSETLAILAVDGNKLKTINDEYGHHTGDEAIKHIANAMKRVFRDSDYLVRSGGDEFLAILPGCTPPRVLELKEKLQQQVSAQLLRPMNIAVTVSVGVAFKRPDDELDHALIMADENLYQDKGKRG